MNLDELKQLAGSIEGYCPEDACVLLYSLAKDNTSKGAIIDIGSMKGRTTICFAKAQQENQDDLVYALEANLFGTKDILLKNIDRFQVKDWVVPIFKHSSEVSKGWSKPIKLIWIDTDGNYFSGKSDFFLWEPYLVIGGVFAFSCSSSPNIKKIVKDCFVDSKRFEKITTAGSIVFAYKSKETPSCPAWKLKYIRILYSLFFSLQKISYGLRDRPLLSWLKKERLKKLINSLFNKSVLED